MRLLLVAWLVARAVAAATGRATSHAINNNRIVQCPTRGSEITKPFGFCSQSTSRDGSWVGFCPLVIKRIRPRPFVLNPYPDCLDSNLSQG